MSADELRQAAETLLERATAEGEWPCAEYIRSGIRHLQRNCEVECSHGEWDDTAEAWVNDECPAPEGGWGRYSTGVYIATMHPGVGLALADWLDYVSDRAKARTGLNYRYAIQIARLINGGSA